MDDKLESDVMDTYQKGIDSEATQKELRGITSARFTTITNLKKLKNRVDTELLANRDSLKSKLSKMADFVYTMYNENILLSIPVLFKNIYICNIS